MAMIPKKNEMPHLPGRQQAGTEPILLSGGPRDSFSSEIGPLQVDFAVHEETSAKALVAVVGASEAPADHHELLRLRERAFAEVGALRGEIERLTEMKEQTRADLRRLLQDCLARLDGAGAGPGIAASEELSPVSPETAVGADGSTHPGNRSQGLAGLLCHPLRRRLAVAGWDQAPMLLMLTLIILQQLVPTIQRMALLG